MLLALALVRGLLYAVLNPPFASPDEQAHFQYVAYLATNGASGPIGEEGHQPALYYALMVPAYWLTAGHPEAVQLLAIRIASIPFLLGTVLFTWLAARKMAPDKPFVAIVATAFVALQPELAYFSASANNDNAANFMAAVLTYLVVLLLRGKPGKWVIPAAAAAVGASLFTKSQILPIAAISGSVLAGCAIAQMRASGRWIPILYMIVPVLLTAAALTGHADTQMLAVATSAGSVLLDGKAWGIAQQAGLQPFPYLFASFWASFVGESVGPADVWYLGPSAIVLLAAVGYSARLVSAMVGNPLSRSGVMLCVALLCMLVGVWLVAYLRFLYNFQFPEYIWRFQVLQGRFLDVALVPLVLLVADGWGLLVRQQLRALSSALILAAFVTLDASSLAVLASHYTWPVSQ